MPPFLFEMRFEVSVQNRPNVAPIPALMQGGGQTAANFFHPEQITITRSRYFLVDLKETMQKACDEWVKNGGGMLENSMLYENEKMRRYSLCGPASGICLYEALFRVRDPVSNQMLEARCTREGTWVREGVSTLCAPATITLTMDMTKVARSQLT
jgi:hypothetical protein